jgi:transcriptional regulator
MILKALSWGPRHGYGVVKWIRQASEEALQVEDGAMYPAFHRIEDRGWITSEWGLSENNRRARFYSLTAAGRRQLEREMASWAHFSEALWKIVDASEGT